MPIPGTRSPERLAENAAAVQIALTDLERRTLDRLLAEQPVAAERYHAVGTMMLNG